MSSSQEKLEKAKIYLKLSLRTDQTIQEANQRLTQKIQSVFTLASALIPIVAGLGYFVAKQTSSYWILFPTFFSLVFLVSAIVFGLWLFRPIDFKYFDPKPIVEKYMGQSKSLRFFVNKWASTLCDIADKNAKIVNAKKQWLNRMYLSVVLGLLILAVSFLFLALSLV